MTETLAARELLYRGSPATRGDLTEQGKALVSNTPLAAVAQRLRLGAHLQGGGSLPPGQDTTKILAEAREAVFGAIHLDAGYHAAAAVAECWLLGHDGPGESAVQP